MQVGDDSGPSPRPDTGGDRAVLEDEARAMLCGEEAEEKENTDPTTESRVMALMPLV